MPLLMLGVRSHLYMIVHQCMFKSDLRQQVSAGAIIRIHSFLSASFSQAIEECVEHPHVQAPNQCESRRMKNRGEGETMRRETVADSARVWAGACVQQKKRKAGREIRESLKWDSKDRSAQIDIAITKKAIPQLGIHLHTLEPGCSPATVSLRLAQQVSHTQARHAKRSSLGSHCAHTLTMKTPSIVHVAHTTGERDPSFWQGKNKKLIPKKKTTSLSSYTGILHR